VNVHQAVLSGGHNVFFFLIKLYGSNSAVVAVVHLDGKVSVWVIGMSDLNFTVLKAHNHELP